MGKVKWILFLLLLPVPVPAQNRVDRMPIKLSVSIEPQTDNKNLILYTFDRPLEMADFKGKADHSSPGVAATFSGMQMSFSGEEKKGMLYVDVQLLIYFDKTKSWTKKEGRTDDVLAHEQIHFDITAIFACAFAQAVKEYNFTPSNIKQELRDLNQQFVQNMQRTQNNYDRETEHGTIRQRQAEWAARIRTQLNKLTCYQ